MSHHLLPVLLNNVFDGVLVVDERARVVVFNPAAEKITGLLAGRVLGRSIQSLGEFSALVKRIYGDGRPLTGELFLPEVPALTVKRVPVALGDGRTGLLITFQLAERSNKPEQKNPDLRRRGLTARYSFNDIVGESAVMAETICQARKYTRSDAAILITGESGTGKELFAQSIHNESGRRHGPFVAVNCAALPESLLESELFGYEEGAFTGAKKGGKRGLFVLASGGSIFLDEIGDLSPALQARLLRVLQQKEVLPVGGQRVIPVDVRVISATNRNLSEAVERGEFRMDLYYRLNVLHLHIPSLRQRLEDLPLLFKHFFQRLTEAEGIAGWPVPDRVLDELKNYPWPGNVRELEGFVERYVALGEEEPRKFTTFRGLLQKLQQKRRGAAAADQQVLVLQLGRMEEMERQIIEQVMEMVGGGKGELARLLGYSRTTLWKKLKKYGCGGAAKQ
ncbi:MAG: sigma-54 interaction domain-containing protein [Bacillota bacterium]